MSKKVLIIYAHPEPSSLTRQLVEVSVECLTAQGHEVLQSDLYAMGWKATFDEHDYPERANLQRLSFGAESAHAYRHRRQTPDVAAEQNKVLAADAVIFQFPLWWYGMPAIMKGWIDRVWAAGLAHRYKDAGNLTAADATAAKEAWRTRLEDLFTDAPFPFRPQNGGGVMKTFVTLTRRADGKAEDFKRLAKPEVLHVWQGFADYERLVSS